MNRTQKKALADARLAAIYARVPAMKNCKGHCHTTCGPIEMSNREREKIREKHGILIPEPPPGVDIRDVDGSVDCPALTPLKRCAVYEDRPYVCRIWGASETLPCIYGCEVDGPPLPSEEEVVMFAEINEAGGWPYSLRNSRVTPDELRESWATYASRHKEATKKITARALRGDRQRAREKGMGEHLA